MAKLVAKTYAESLFEVGVEEDSLDTLLEELEFIVKVFKQSPDFFELFKTPRINIDERKGVIQQTFGDKISKTMLNFLKILLDKKRTSAIFDIKNEFKTLVYKHNDIIEATVVSAVQLEDSQLEKLTQRLIKSTGSKIIINNRVDESLIGGVVLKLGDKVVDDSIKSRLKSIKEELAQLIV